MLKRISKQIYLISKCKSILNVLISPDKFKFSMTSSEVASIIQQNLPKSITGSIIVLADGGQGSLDVISKMKAGQWIDCSVKDPLFRTISSKYFVSQNQSFIQMARASGLALLPKQQRNPLYTTTFGTGELILDSLRKGHKKINVLIGGSATNDGGIGAANALGYIFTNQRSQSIVPIGVNLQKIKNIAHQNSQISELLKKSEISVYTDVKNMFTGLNGATMIYGPQKGVTPQIIQQLQRGMINLNNLFKKIYKKDANTIIGSGAAGGLGGACSILLNSKLQSGIDLLFTITDYESYLQKTDLVITGEGLVDGQTFEGKVVKGVIDRCRIYDKDVLIVCAYAQNKELYQGNPRVQLVQLLKQDEIHIIDKQLTKSRLANFIKTYFKQKVTIY